MRKIRHCDDSAKPIGLAGSSNGTNESRKPIYCVELLSTVQFFVILVKAGEQDRPGINHPGRRKQVREIIMQGFRVDSREMTGPSGVASGWVDDPRPMGLSSPNCVSQGVEQGLQNVGRLTSGDDLTGLPDQRGFRKLLESAWHFATRQNLLLSVIMLDVDDFAQYGSGCRPSAQDELICELGGFLARNLRVYDLLARFGPSEFALLLLATDRTDARVSRSACEKALRNETGRTGGSRQAWESRRWRIQPFRQCNWSIRQLKRCGRPSNKERTVSFTLQKSGTTP